MVTAVVTTTKCAWHFANATVFYLSGCVWSSQKMVPSQLYLNVVRDEASLSVLPPPQSLQCIFLSAGLLTPVRYMTWAQRTRQAENKHLTWVLLSSVVFRQTSPHGGDLSLHQPELLKGLTHCLYRVLLETNGIWKCFSFFRFRNLI